MSQNNLRKLNSSFNNCVALIHIIILYKYLSFVNSLIKYKFCVKIFADFVSKNYTQKMFDDISKDSKKELFINVEHSNS